MIPKEVPDERFQKSFLFSKAFSPVLTILLQIAAFRGHNLGGRSRGPSARLHRRRPRPTLGTAE